MTQAEALDILKLGYSVFLTGAPGAGKTYLLNQYIKYLRQHKKGVAVTASTGIAATHMNGTTIHSWTGMGIKDSFTTRDIKKLLKKSYLRKHFKENNVLIIDEISMLSAGQFENVDKICRAFKGNSEAFGGMQVVCSGDLFQLPPVERSGDRPKFFVESNVWHEIDMKICYLDEQHRQSDDDLLLLLGLIRKNATEDAQNLLMEKDLSGREFLDNPTRLYSHNLDVDRINNLQLEKINEKKHGFTMESKGSKNLVESLVKNCMAPEILVLKKGAKVMFVKNNFEKGFVNGTQGKVAGFDDEGMPLVETIDGKIIAATPEAWTIDENDDILASIEQIPLRLAWAITVHKSQGMSLDAAEIDLSKSFVEGMGYVAFSRLRSLAGLKLLGVNEMAFRVNEEIVAFDREIIRASEALVDDLKNINKDQMQRRQKDFLDSLLTLDKEKSKKEKSQKISKDLGDEEDKIFECKMCGRKIKQNGNCLPCNIKLKSERNKIS